MKNIFAFLLLIFFNGEVYSQQGEWTWMKGDSDGVSFNYGVQGVAAAANHPPITYEGVSWTDKQGNFWLFTGYYHSDLWKYDPMMNLWTWMKGTGIANQPPVYGVQGIPSPANLPGGRAIGSLAWVDTANNLWLYSGYGVDANGVHGALSDLWKYDIGTNEWTWMGGPDLGDQNAVYGSYQVPSVTNSPGSRFESNASWIDAENNLWLFGGKVYDDAQPSTFRFGADVWKYNTSSNEWTWMKGSSGIQNPHYGVQGQADSSNTPGSRLCYSAWKDLQGNFWLFGGSSDFTYGMNDLWKFNPSILEWTWINGDTVEGDDGVYDSVCVFNSGESPASRYDNRACWTDKCGNFWMFGGFRETNFLLNDLWVYSIPLQTWTLVSGSDLPNAAGFYGTQGVGNALNHPAGRCGASCFTDRNGKLWLYGGITQYSYKNDLWKFTPNTNCFGCNLPQFDVSANSLCEKFCVNFFDESINNPTAWQWFFPGGNPSSSTDQNPANVCYNEPGSYDVTYISFNANGSDTLILHHYITVHATPPTPAITQNGYTLTSSAADFYQWQLNAVDIVGATDQSYTVQQTGFYTVIVSDENGCVNSSTVYVEITGIEELSDQNISIYPNPSNGNFVIEMLNGSSTGEVSIEVSNSLGQTIFSVDEKKFSSNWTKNIDLSSVMPGIYVIVVASNNNFVRKKIIITSEQP